MSVNFFTKIWLLDHPSFSAISVSKQLETLGRMRRDELFLLPLLRNRQSHHGSALMTLALACAGSTTAFLAFSAHILHPYLVRRLPISPHS